MKKYVTTIIILIGFIAQSQELRNRYGDVYYEANFYKNEFKNHEGSPYLIDKFIPAKINELSETQLVRFDAYEDRIELMAKKQNFVILEDGEPYRIVLLDGSERVFVTKSFVDSKGETKASFFELIAEKTEFQLYVKEKVKFTKAEKAQGYADAKPARFKKLKNRYLVSDITKKTDHLLLLPSKLKPFLSIFPTHNNQLKKFIKENKLDLELGDDLKQIFEFYFKLE